MESNPRVFMLDVENLLRVRSLIFEGDEGFVAADERLLEAANKALATRPFSVVEKEEVPPSNNRCDYMSLAPNWWPDPDVEGGKPYLNREGEVNGECEGYDHPRLVGLCSAVGTLSTAYFFSDFEDFAERAALLLRIFFLDEQTAMSPHLEYAQAIRGRCLGRAEGIMDAHGFSWLVDHVGLLVNSSSWNADDQADIEAWFSRYLEWLSESEFGVEARGREDSYGICCDVQVTALALFCRKKGIAQQAFERAQARLFTLVDPDGSQPGQVESADSLNRCMTNVSAFFDLADLGRSLGYDLWSGKEGDRLQSATLWLINHGFDAEWPWQRGTSTEALEWIPLLLRAAQRLPGRDVDKRLQQIGDEAVVSDWSYLLYSSPER
jgi:hypothetical protein